MTTQYIPENTMEAANLSNHKKQQRMCVDMLPINRIVKTVSLNASGQEI